MAAARFCITPFRLHRSENQAMAVTRFGITPYHPVCLARFSITPFRLHRSENQAMAAAQFGLTPYHPERNSRSHTSVVCFDSIPSQCKEFVQEDMGAFGLKVNGSEEFVEEATRHMGLKPNPDDKTFTCSGKVYEYSDISFLKERNKKFLENLSHLSDMFEEGSSPLTALQAIRSRGEAIVILEDSQGDVIFEADKDFHVPKDFGNNEELQSALDESSKS